MNKYFTVLKVLCLYLITLVSVFSCASIKEEFNPQADLKTASLNFLEQYKSGISFSEENLQRAIKLARVNSEAGDLDSAFFLYSIAYYMSRNSSPEAAKVYESATRDIYASKEQEILSANSNPYPFYQYYAYDIHPTWQIPVPPSVAIDAAVKLCTIWVQDYIDFDIVNDYMHAPALPVDFMNASDTHKEALRPFKNKVNILWADLQVMYGRDPTIDIIRSHYTWAGLYPATAWKDYTRMATEAKEWEAINRFDIAYHYYRYIKDQEGIQRTVHSLFGQYETLLAGAQAALSGNNVETTGQLLSTKAESERMQRIHKPLGELKQFWTLFNNDFKNQKNLIDLKDYLLTLASYEANYVERVTNAARQEASRFTSTPSDAAKKAITTPINQSLAMAIETLEFLTKIYTELSGNIENIQATQEIIKNYQSKFQ